MQMRRYHTLALMLGVDAAQLPDVSTVESLASSCLAMVGRLGLSEPPSPVVIQGWSSAEELMQYAADILKREECNLLNVEPMIPALLGQCKDYRDLDIKELSKPAYAAQLRQRNLCSGTDLEKMAVGNINHQASLLGHSALYAQLYGLGFNPDDVLAAFILQRGTCPVDGREIHLRANPGATPHTSRRISADRIYGKTGLHSLHGECIWVASACNLARSARIDV